MIDRFLKLQERLGHDLEQHVPLKPYTYLKVGGSAEFFYVARSVDLLLTAVQTAQAMSLPWTILGNASNVVISDAGIPGLVIQNRTSDMVFVSGSNEAMVASGVPLARLIIEAANHELAGLELLFGIPATVGGAIYGNIEAHGTVLTQYLREITLYKPTEQKVVKVPVGWLQAEYRSTRLKSERAEGGQESPIILMAKFAFLRQKRDVILAKLKDTDAWRRSHQPIGSANCGSVFRNPGQSETERAGYLLDRAGAKTIRHGRVRVSPQHANFLVNEGDATAEDVRAVIREMRDRVEATTGIVLKEEIEYLGDWSPPSVTLSSEEKPMQPSKDSL